MKKFILGFDIGGTKCAVNLADVDNGVILTDKLGFPTETEKGVEQTIQNLISNGRKILVQNDLTTADLTAIGISCGGPLDARSGLVLSPPHLPGWDGIPIREILSKEFSVPAFLQNDANACALVEWKLGAGRGTQDMIFITMGTGFGAGVIAGGKMIEGACSLAGEVGHVRLESDGPYMFGKKGSVEAYCSGEGIEKNFGNGVPLKIIAEKARNGDAESLEVFNKIGRQLGKALAILLDLFNPERIIIGSIFTRCEDLLRDSMNETLSEQALPGAFKACRVLPAETGELIGDYASILIACYELGIDALPLDESLKNGVRAHLERLIERYPVLSNCKRDILNAFFIMRGAFKKGRKLLLCGNGGSAADCGHIAGELMKGFLLKRESESKTGQPLQGALPAIDLTQHNALSTAFGNDVDHALVYAQQVYGYGKSGDVLLCISTSGEAKNVIVAASTARVMNIPVISLTGAGGGKLSEISDITVRVPADSTPEIQELHLPAYHCLCAMLEEEFFGIS